MARTVQQVIAIMRRAIGRRNTEDPDSSDEILITYINDFLTLQMPNGLKLNEKFSSFEFQIDTTNTTGIFDFPDSATSEDFINLDDSGLISAATPADNSLEWWDLCVLFDEKEFFHRWGFNNHETLVKGGPSEVLYWDNKLTFRAIQDKAYIVKLFGYKRPAAVGSSSSLEFDYWLRYVAYGAARDYAADFRLESEALSNIERNFGRERQLLLTRTHNQIKVDRPPPTF